MAWFTHYRATGSIPAEHKKVAVRNVQLCFFTAAALLGEQLHSLFESPCFRVLTIVVSIAAYPRSRRLPELSLSSLKALNFQSKPSEL